MPGRKRHPRRVGASAAGGDQATLTRVAVHGCLPELVHSLLPCFMVSVLGASIRRGHHRGVAEGATASITRCSPRRHQRSRSTPEAARHAASGSLALDQAGLSWPRPSRGHGSPLCRFGVGKGDRGAPRDALVADITPRRSGGLWTAARGSIRWARFCGAADGDAAHGVVGRRHQARALDGRRASPGRGCHPRGRGPRTRGRPRRQRRWRRDPPWAAPGGICRGHSGG